jgi:hypothetical protein
MLTKKMDTNVCVNQEFDVTAYNCTLFVFRIQELNTFGTLETAK